MSGGHYDYRILIMVDLAEDIADDAKKEEDEAVRNAMDYCAAQLKELAGLARTIEWYMSADYGPEYVVEAFKTASK